MERQDLIGAGGGIEPSRGVDARQGWPVLQLGFRRVGAAGGALVGYIIDRVIPGRQTVYLRAGAGATPLTVKTSV